PVEDLVVPGLLVDACTERPQGKPSERPGGGRRAASWRPRTLQRSHLAPIVTAEAKITGVLSPRVTTLNAARPASAYRLASGAHCVVATTTRRSRLGERDDGEDDHIDDQGRILNQRVHSCTEAARAVPVLATTLFVEMSGCRRRLPGFSL